MKKYFIILLPFSLLFHSCTKEVEIDLDYAGPKLVVEALLSDNPEPYRVKLSLMSEYFDQQGEHYVTNASVYISDDMGNKDTLYYTQKGIYATAAVKQGIPGHTYALEVVYEGKSYTAAETMQTKSYIDSVTYIYNEGSAFIDAGYNVIINTQEIPNEANYYRYLFYKNDTLQTDPFKYFVTDDQYVENTYIVAQVPYNYQSGDSARVELQNITKEYYIYLFGINNQISSTGGPFDPIPGNPKTNISNGGLGYFAVIARHTKSIIIP